MYTNITNQFTSGIDLGAIEYVTGILAGDHQLNFTDNDIIKLSQHSQLRLAWIEYFNRFKINSYQIYHLTLTFTCFKSKDLSKEEAQSIFELFYKCYLLKQVVGSNYGRPSKQLVMPTTVAFVERHAYKGRPNGSHFNSDRYHIHAMIAAHPETKTNLDSYLGENTFKIPGVRHCSRIMTSYLCYASDYCAAYTSKSYHSYEDYQIFGPKKLLH